MKVRGTKSIRTGDVPYKGLSVRPGGHCNAVRAFSIASNNM